MGIHHDMRNSLHVLRIVFHRANSSGCFSVLALYVFFIQVHNVVKINNCSSTLNNDLTKKIINKIKKSFIYIQFIINSIISLFDFFLCELNILFLKKSQNFYLKDTKRHTVFKLLR